MTYEEPLVALADPTRRRLLEQLARRDHSVGELALIIQVSQPAISQHLRVLRDARLVTIRAEGTRQPRRRRVPDHVKSAGSWGLRRPRLERSD